MNNKFEKKDEKIRIKYMTSTLFSLFSQIL